MQPLLSPDDCFEAERLAKADPKVRGPWHCSYHDHDSEQQQLGLITTNRHHDHHYQRPFSTTSWSIGQGHLYATSSSPSLDACLVRSDQVRQLLASRYGIKDPETEVGGGEESRRAVGKEAGRKREEGKE